MSLMDDTAAAAQLHRDIDEYRTRVDLARRNPWHGGDVLEPEYERFLASLAARPAHAVAAPAPRNSWRESIEQLH